LWIACPPSTPARKYNDEVFQFSVGLNGVGTKAVNALSDVFVVRSYRGGEFVEANFKRGKLKNEKKGKDAKQDDGTYVEFEPDTTIFKERISSRSILNAACAITAI